MSISLICKYLEKKQLNFIINNTKLKNKFLGNVNAKQNGEGGNL